VRNNKDLIGLDLRMWAHPGIGRYMRELFGAMFKQEDPKRFVYLAHEGDEPSIFEALRGGRFVPARSKIYSLAEQSELSKFSREAGLLHVPHFNAPLACRSKLVVTIHDLIYLKEKRFSGNPLAKLYVRALLGGIQKNANAVIAVSDFTRRDLVLTFPGLADRTSVIHEAASSNFLAGDARSAADVREKFGLSGEYALFVGSLKAHKNLPVLLDAFDSLWRKADIPAQLVIVGRKDPKETALLERIERSRAYVNYLGEQPDETLSALYRGARTLVIPSLWEGFGLTAIEAMASGTPVISSDRASLPEVVGDAGLLFDPESAEQLEAHLTRIFKNDMLRNTLSRQGLERAKNFSWKKAALETLAVYEKVL